MAGELDRLVGGFVGGGFLTRRRRKFISLSG